MHGQSMANQEDTHRMLSPHPSLPPSLPSSQLATHFDAYVSIPKIAEIKQTIDRINGQLNEQITRVCTSPSFPASLPFPLLPSFFFSCLLLPPVSNPPLPPSLRPSKKWLISPTPLPLQPSCIGRM